MIVHTEKIDGQEELEIEMCEDYACALLLYVKINAYKSSTRFLWQRVTTKLAVSLAGLHQEYDRARWQAFSRSLQSDVLQALIISDRLEHGQKNRLDLGDLR
jgi:hypothetical protein